MISFLSNPSDYLASPHLFGELTEKNQLTLIESCLDKGEEGLAELIRFLHDRSTHPPTLAMGKAYQALFNSSSSHARHFLEVHLPFGITPLVSAHGLDYSQLHHLLATRNFQDADRLTLGKLCELSGEQAVKRNWIYFSEVNHFSVIDLQTINSLWFFYSEGRFGFSVQRELWLGVGKDWEKLWKKIGWKNSNIWTRYPQEFTWDLTAPRGHLPLSNQLRGVQVMKALLTHSAWEV